MSLHLIACVRPLTDLLPSEKLALLAFADSADETTQIGWPGIDAVAEWAGVSTSRAKAITKSLADRGLLQRHSGGHNGRRARYVVFPAGCCSEHPRPRDDDQDTGSSGLAEQLAERLGLSVEDVARALEGPLDDASLGAADETQQDAEGSRTQSSGSVEGSRPQAPTPATTPVRVPSARPKASVGSRLGTAGSTRSSSSTTTPPSPHGSAAGGACPAHHPNPVGNCRGCGTTPRQLAAAAERQAAERAAADSGPRCPGGTRWTADGDCSCTPPVAHPARHELEQAAAS